MVADSTARVPIRVLSAALAGLVITIVQVALLMAVSPKSSLIDRYLSLCQSDSNWYANILVKGYHTTIPPVPLNMLISNVAFFRGYPVVARLVHWFGVPAYVALLVVAQAASVWFWIHFLLLFNELGAGAKAKQLCSAALLAYPAVFSWWQVIPSRSFALASVVTFSGAGAQLQHSNAHLRCFCWRAFTAG